VKQRIRFIATALSPALVIAALICFGTPTASAEQFERVDQGERLQRLPADQKALAERMLAFIEAMDEKYFGRTEALNGGAQYEELERTTEYTHYKIKVTRGPVVEKLGRMLSEGQKTQPGRGDSTLIWGRFYSLDFHAKTPLVGMLHATIVMNFFEDGRGTTGGFLGVMPGTRVEQDIAGLKQVMDTHFAAYGKESELPLYRKLLCKGTDDTVEFFRRRPACVGASYYGPPIFRGDTAKSYEFIEKSFDLFVDAYVDTIEQRADDPFTDEDVAAYDVMRKRWLIDQLFSDPFASQLVPFEIWSLANVPPVIKF